MYVYIYGWMYVCMYVCYLLFNSPYSGLSSGVEGEGTEEMWRHGNTPFNLINLRILYQL